jgi:AcrR family transcriptional regulator
LSGGREGYVERRQKLIEAAASVFQTKGYGAASLGDVANALGTDRASLYYYVESKEELFHAVVFKAAEDNVLKAEAIRDRDDSVVNKLSDFIHELMTSYEVFYPYLFVYIQEKMTSFAPEEDGEESEWAADMRNLNERYEAAVHDVVQTGVDEGVLKPLISSRVLSYGIIGMVNWSHRWFRPNRHQAAEVAATFSRLFLDGMTDHPGPS